MYVGYDIRPLSSSPPTSTSRAASSKIHRSGYWLALPAPRNALVDAVHPHPWLKRVILRLPAWMQPAPQRYGLILRLDRDGRPVESFHDPAGGSAPITNVVQHHGMLYFGSYQYDRIGRMPMP